MKKQTGQIILGLILIMVVALGFGLSIVQKSLVDVSTSSKVEDSSRAFSAAEAGIEKALKSDTSDVNFTGNRSSATIYDSGLLPALPAANTRQAPLEYPPLAKEEVAHFWLADPNSLSNPPTRFYNTNSLDVYWGNSSSDMAALEVTVVYYDGTGYKSQKWYLDNSSAGRIPPNGFEQIICSGQCKKNLDFSVFFTPSTNLILVRTRLLYNSTSQPIAIQAVGTCGQDCSIPPQARELISTGVSGETKRRVKVFKIDKVVPPYFDFAIFSAGDIKK